MVFTLNHVWSNNSFNLPIKLFENKPLEKSQLISKTTVLTFRRLKLSTYLIQLHNRCASHVSPDCNLGVNRVHILPPVSICPTVLDRQHSVSKEKNSQKGSAAKLSRSDSIVNSEAIVSVSQDYFISLKYWQAINISGGCSSREV